MAFHPSCNIVAAGLVDGTVEIHDIKIGTAGTTAIAGERGMTTPRANNNHNDGEGGEEEMMMDEDDVDEDEEVDDTILASIFVAKEILQRSSSNTIPMPPDVELDSDSTSNNNEAATATAATNMRGGEATHQGPSCRCVLFSNNPSSMNTFVNADDDDWTVDSKDDPIRRSSKRQTANAIIGEEAVVASNENSSNDGGGGEYLYTACNGGSLRCINTALAVKSLSTDLHQQLENDDNNDDVKDDNTSTNNTIVWSIENAHPVGINKIYQLPNCSPIGPVLITGDDSGTVRLWDVRQCSSSTITNAGDDTSTIDDMDSNNNTGNNSSKKKKSNKKMKKNTTKQQQQQKQQNNNPFDKLMELPTECIQSWKVNKDYISDFTCTPDGTVLFATSGDGTLSVFNISYVATQQRRSSSSKNINNRNRCNIVNTFDNDDDESSKKNTTTSTWDTMGYCKSDNIEDELLSCVLLKKSKKLCVGTQDGTLCLYTYGQWADMSDRFPGHPQSIDAILKIDEDTILTGSSDGLIRAVQLLPNSLLGVLGGHDHDGFPVEGLGWSAYRRLVGSISHDEYIRLWDASLLNDDYDDDVDIDINDGNNVQEEKESTKTKAAAGDDSDDWDDMDEDDNSDDDDDNKNDSDDDDNSNDGTGSDKPKKREKIFKTDNESFFSDL
jgi:WD40 repeat protein